MTLSSWCLLLSQMGTSESFVWGMEAGAVKVVLVSLIVGCAVLALLVSCYRQYAISCQMKALIAESEVRRYALMLGDAITNSAEQEAKADAMMAQLTPRMQAIEEARKKCGTNLSPEEPVGTFADPVYLQRPNIKQDDWAWVATIEELTEEKR